MALDKLVDSSALDSGLTSIANAIRAKTGEDGTMTMAQMPNKIEEIQTGIEPKEYTWQQTDAQVQDFLDYMSAHPYSADDYTYSYFDTHTVDFTSNPERPKGQAVTTDAGVLEVGAYKKTVTAGSNTIFNTVPNAATLYALNKNGDVKQAGTLTPNKPLRQIMATTRNFRDIGGWACDGGTIKYGILYRAGEISGNDTDIVLNQLGIRTELDLTGDGIPGAITGLEHKGYVGGYAMYALTPVDAWKVNIRAVFDAAKRNEPLIFHCSAGADRTGTLACVIEGVLGVSQNNIDMDYELTSFYQYNQRKRNEDYQGGGGADWRRLISQIKAISGTTFRDKCVNFIASLGFTAAEINAFRAAMIDGTPETVTPSIDTYTVTNTLTNATSDNAAASATEYQPYTAKITPANGYTISSVQVKMGGVDVTANVWSGTQTVLRRKVTVSLTHCTSDNSRASVIDGQGYAATLTAAEDYTLEGASVTILMGGVDVSTFYKDGVIAIPNVTGDLEITVTAVKSAPSYTNQIPISTDTDGSIYNGIGYMLNMRLPTNGVPAAYDGCLVTGFIPFSIGDIIRVNKFCASGNIAAYAKVVFYNANHTVIAAIQTGQLVDAGTYVVSQPLTWTPGNTIHDLGFGRDVDISEAAYLRLSITGYNDVAADIVCTINEEIS